jgi:hypothetical protein
MTGGTLFTAGQTLTVSASGATVPGFGASVVAPAVVALTAPASSASGFTITTSSNLAVAWTGGQSGAQMLLEGVVLPNSSPGYNYFVCTWDAAAGKATVPSAMMTGLAGQSGYLVYGQSTTTNFTAGGYAIGLSALPYTGGSATFK